MEFLEESQRNKLTLLVDMGWVTMRYFSVLLKDFDKSLPEQVRDEATWNLAQMMSRSITNVLNQLDAVDNIVLLTEGGSWRKSVQKPRSFIHYDYKGNRVHPIEFDWDRIWKASGMICERAGSLGITVSTLRRAEGDDWAWWWSRHLNDNGVNVLIWSSDNDLKQLVSKNQSTGAWTLWYNEKAGLWKPEDMNMLDTPIVDFFMNPDPQMDDPVLDRLEARVRDIHYINPSEIIIDKIVFGDSGDNIMPVVSCEKGSRRYKIQKKEWQKISNELGIKNIDDFENKELDIVDRIIGLGKYGDDPQEIRECLEYNMRMVWLNGEILPSDLIMSMSECQYKQAPVRDLRLNSELLMDPDREVMDISEDLVASEEDIESLEVDGLPF